MLTQEDDVDAHAFRNRGWSISAIARHLGHDRKTIRAYLSDERSAGVRALLGEDRFAAYVDYCRERLIEDPHLWAMTLFDEVTAECAEQIHAGHADRHAAVDDDQHGCRADDPSPHGDAGVEVPGQIECQCFH